MGVLVGMIGLTHPHSPGYLRTLDALDVVDGVVLCDPVAAAREQAAQQCRKAEQRHVDLESLLARSDVPIVLVALPTDRVPDVVTRAARAGKHVICEKPCARSADELRPVLAVLEEHRVQFTTCYLWRNNPAIQKMRELVRAGALGRLTSVELRMVTTQVRLRDPSHWLFKRDVAGGGILSWLGCHWLDLLRYLTGQEAVSVSAMVDTLSGEAIDVEDVASVNLRLSDGALASLYAGYLLPSGRPGYEAASYDQSIILRGTQGTLRFDKDGDDQIVTLESSAVGWQTAPRQAYRLSLPAHPAYGGVHGLAFLDDFIRRALGGEGQDLVSADDALRVLEILDAAYLSARSGRTVDVRR
ncbi:MAG TPA: Gfo/Idh/MocA family oxidoreductase [Chloroflexota bacterium]|nr:Gfo/Idh/MocA family oxidoreductase [Chloroflexota bacterium]